MVRFRPIKKYGNGYVIALIKKDITDLNLKVGDEIDIEDAVKRTSIP